MSPSARSAEAVGLPAEVPQELLADGEVIILAVRPSPWYVLLVSWPAVVLAALVLAAVSVSVDVLHLALPAERRLIALVCLAGVMLRLTVAALQWVGRLYLLTDRRILRLGGLIRGDIIQLPLDQVIQTTTSASTGERVLGVGTIHFCAGKGVVPEAGWLHVANVAEVRQIVDETIDRFRKMHNHHTARPAGGSDDA